MAVIVALPAAIALSAAPFIVTILLSEEVKTQLPVESEVGAFIVKARSPTVAVIGKKAPNTGIAPKT